MDDRALFQRLVRLAHANPTARERLLPLLKEAKDHYDGPSLESGGTSIKGQGAAPYVRRMVTLLKPGMKILDYGAGKYARNADYLRGLGFEVFASDPFNGSGTDGWGVGQVAMTPPTGVKFDLGFTAYVLNVVPESEEDKIIRKVAQFSKKQVHITRNLDIFVSVKNALGRGDKVVRTFFEREYLPSHKNLDKAFNGGTLTDDQIMDFCKFGVQTSRGFQRIPFLDKKGFQVAAKTQGFKAFLK